MAHETTRVFGILNVTPDSFSDGGRYLDPDVAIDHARAMIAAGAHVIDVGGESTRPGAEDVSQAEEERRVVPIVHALAAEGVVVSVDTRRARVAERAMEAGARWINDVSGATFDPAMPAVLAATGADVILVHSDGPSGDLRHYRDVVGTVRDELARRTERVVSAGVDPARVVLDPGLGFSKLPDDNWALLAALPELSAGAGVERILVGASRKRFLAPLAVAGRTPDPRDTATAAISALLARDGVWAVRVHDVPGTVAALAVGVAWRSAADARVS